MTRSIEAIDVDALLADREHDRLLLLSRKPWREYARVHIPCDEDAEQPICGIDYAADLNPRLKEAAALAPDAKLCQRCDPTITIDNHPGTGAPHRESLESMPVKEFDRLVEDLREGSA